jgi:D-glycerate 3-kinase
MARHKHSIPRPGFAPALVDAILDDALGGDGAPGLATFPRVYGIAGLQGSGKSTLAAQMASAGSVRGLTVVVLSIDDFYLTRRERQALGRLVHPLLATRGPPATHDLSLACATLDRLREFSSGDCLTLPRFDKIGDRRLPPSRWPQVRQKPDLIVFEGWFLKVPPEKNEALVEPVNVLERVEDSDGRWRRYCNTALAAYEPLWQRIDRLCWLRGPDFEVVPAWRWQQEQSLRAKSPGRSAMSRAEIERFVLLFERVSRQAQRRLGDIADTIVDLDEKHRAQLRRYRGDVSA